MKKLLLVAVLLMVVAMASFASDAVQSANVTATVNAALTLTKLTDLAIGNVFAGTPTSVLYTAAGAASFVMQGAGLTPTTVAVVFPTNLIISGGLTPETQLPFTGTTYTHTIAGAAGSTVYSVPVTTLVGGQLWIYNGGAVTSISTQQAGQYTGTITVTVTQ